MYEVVLVAGVQVSVGVVDWPPAWSTGAVKVTVPAAETLRVKVAEGVAAGLLISLTLTVTEELPAAGGVPEMPPDALLMVSPDGNRVADQVYGALPPVADAVAAGLLVSLTRTVTEELPTADGVPEMAPDPLLMVSPDGNPVADQVYGALPIADAVAWVGLVESVTVIVTELDPADVGVPDIWPLLLMLKPEGRPLADQVYVRRVSERRAPA